MIFVFKTTVKTKRQMLQLKPYINNTFPHAKWNFDLQDIDKILRIECEENIVLKIIHLLQSHNHGCEELE